MGQVGIGSRRKEAEEEEEEEGGKEAAGKREEKGPEADGQMTKQREKEERKREDRENRERGRERERDGRLFGWAVRGRIYIYSAAFSEELRWLQYGERSITRGRRAMCERVCLRVCLDGDQLVCSGLV